MMNMKRKKRTLSLLALLLLFSLLLCSCGKKYEKTTGAEDINGVESGSTVKTGTVDKRDGEKAEEYKRLPGEKETSEMPTAASDFTYSFIEKESSMSIEGSLDSSRVPMATKTPDLPIEKPLPPILDVPEVPPVSPQAGLLTAGEWNDNKNPEFLKNLLANGQEMNYKTFFTAWNLTPFHPLMVKVTGQNQEAIQNAAVNITDSNGTVLFTAKTDNTGTAFLFYGLNETEETPANINASYQGITSSQAITPQELQNGAITLFLSVPDASVQMLDLMFVVDTTGSMGDEITYLQAELFDVIKRVQNKNGNLPTRLSVNFYRDTEDNYTINPYPFSSNIEEQLGFLKKEYASGGGDYEEAVEQALHNAVYDHEFAEGSTRLLFLVCDAPAHNTQSIRAELSATLREAAAQGIRIIPVASSGVDKGTEFLLRTFAMVTGGTYTFLTNDSGIGGDHLEATVGSYTVENLNTLLERVISSYLN